MEYTKNFDLPIQLLIFSGNPNGLIMTGHSNWNIRVYKVSRNELNKFAERKDAENTGVYFLFGKDAENNDEVYVGEAEKLLTRIKQHLKDEHYWNDCVVVSSKDNSLNKAHVKYLEHKFYKLILNAGRAKLINSTIPTEPSIDEFDVAMLEEFIDKSKLLLNSLGYKILDGVEENLNTKSLEQNIFYIKSARGANGTGVLVSDGFAVLKGSEIANPVSKSMSESLKKLRQKLIDEKTIDESFHFLKDYIFSSPSLAAAIVMGRNANGRTEWKTKRNKSLKEIEENC